MNAQAAKPVQNSLGGIAFDREKAADSIPAIDAEHLTKMYGRHRAVSDLTFSVARGEILGLLGPNGAGKTTTMRILAGYTPANSGRAAIAGYDVLRDSFNARQNLGYLPENAPLYPGMTVREYLNFMAEVKRTPRPSLVTCVDRAIEECNLGEVAKRMIGDLSKGFKQRVGLAQAVLGDPAVLILDEPTVGLDPRQIADIRRLIKGMAGRRAVLLSTHILQEVSLTCHRVLVLSRGKVVASGTPEKLVSGIEKDAAILVTVEGDAAKAADLIGRARGVVSVEVERELSAGVTVFRAHPAALADPRSEISRGLIQAGLGLIEMTRPGISLEDVFLRVVAASEETGVEES